MQVAHNEGTGFAPRLQGRECSLVALSAVAEERSDQLEQSFRTNGLLDEISLFRQFPGCGATRPEETDRVLAHGWLPCRPQDHAVAVAIPQLARCSGPANVHECHHHHQMIGSVHDFDMPALPVLALLITFRHQVAGHGDSNFSRSLKVRVPVFFRVLIEAAPGVDAEIVKRCFRFRLR